MIVWLVWGVAAAIIVTCTYQWFHKVQRIMQERKNSMESAAGQLASCRREVIAARYSVELTEVMEHSESVYRQAEADYHKAFYKPWIWLPAILMGFRAIPPEDYYMLGRNWEA